MLPTWSNPSAIRPISFTYSNFSTSIVGTFRTKQSIFYHAESKRSKKQARFLWSYLNKLIIISATLSVYMLLSFVFCISFQNFQDRFLGYFCKLNDVFRKYASSIFGDSACCSVIICIFRCEFYKHKDNLKFSWQFPQRKEGVSLTLGWLKKFSKNTKQNITFRNSLKTAAWNSCFQIPDSQFFEREAHKVKN